MRLGNKRFGEESGGVFASLTIQGLSDRFRLEVPAILIASVQERIRVKATYGATCERIAAGGSVMWQIERGAQRKGQPQHGFDFWTGTRQGVYGWSGGRRKRFLNEEKGNGLCDGTAGCGAGGNGGRRKRRYGAAKCLQSQECPTPPTMRRLAS